MCKNTLCYFRGNFLKRHLKKNEESNSKSETQKYFNNHNTLMIK